MINRLSWLAGLVLALPTLAAAADGAVEAPGKAAFAPVAARAAAPQETDSPDSGVIPNLASNYVFATTTTGTLADMSSGTTTLLAGNVDDTASALTTIGFDFWFQGTRYTQFSVNDNGLLRLGAAVQASNPYQPLGQGSAPLISAYAADQRTHSGDGKVHFRVSGTAPARKLIVEWLNNQANFNAGGTADLTYQVQLAETSGAIEFVYGSMNMSANGASAGDSNDPQIGFSSGNSAGTVGSVAAPRSGTPAPSFNGTSATPTNNIYNAAGAIAVLTSATADSRRTFSFTPPPVTAPTALNFSAVTPLGMDLNWTDAPNESSYVILRSSDGSNFTQVGTAPANATSFSAASLQPDTNYFWQVVALFEAGASAPLSGSQSTTGGSAVTSTASGGNWSDPATWVGNTVPGQFDNISIAAGASITIDTAAVGLSLVIDSGATLRWDGAAARTLTLGAGLINNGVFETPGGSVVRDHVLSVGGDLINNNTLDFSTNSGNAAAQITFTGANDNTFGGAGAVTDIYRLLLNKGASSAHTLELNTTHFTLRDGSTDISGFLAINNGTLKISGNFPMSTPLFLLGAYVIPASGGLWLNNPNFSVVGQDGPATCAGRFRMSQGVYNVGSTVSSSMGFSAGSQVVIEGGSISTTGRFGVGVSSNAISYSQSGGTITVSTIENFSTSLASFDLGTSLASSINMSGGSIVVQLPGTAASGPRDYRNQGGSGVAGISGGTLQLGNANSGGARAFVLNGVAPNLVIDNTAGGHSATFGATLNYNNLARNITLNSGTTLNIGGNLFLFYGDTFTNNGTFNGSQTGARLGVLKPATNVVYQGSGTVVQPLLSLELQNDLNFTLDPAVNPIVLGRMIFFSGNIANANKLVLGTASGSVVQIGNASTPTAGGGFDVAPGFSGSQTLNYLRTTGSKTTGPEVNPGRAVTSLTLDDNDPTHTLTLAGGDLSVTGSLTLTSGRLVTGNASLVTGSATSVGRTTGFVDGNLVKTWSATGTRAFEIGSASGYSPATVTVTAGNFPGTVKMRAVGSRAPLIAPADKAIKRHWLVDAPGMTANLSFTYLDPLDLPATLSEANLRVYQGQPYVDLGGTLNTTNNTDTIAAQTQFGIFTLAEAGGGTGVVDLAISKTDNLTALETGDSTNYTVVVSNVGTADVSGATVTDTPAGSLSCGSWTCSAGPGASCGANAGAGAINDQPDLPAGTAVTYLQSCAVATVSGASAILNTANVALPVGLSDANPADNSASDTNTLTRLTDLSLSMADGVSTVLPGGSVTYTLVVGNAGPNAAVPAVLDSFPAGLENCVWACAAINGSCAAGGNGSIIDTGTLAAGGTLTYTAVCAVAANASGTITNAANVQLYPGERDPNTANNHASDVNTVLQPADVTVSISDNREFVQMGESLNYTIVVSNPGGAQTATASAAVSNVLPGELSGGSWTCTPTGTASCAGGSGNTLSDTATLPAGSQVTYVYSATVQPGSLDEIITNTVTVSAAGDPNPANNSATDTPQDRIVVFRNGFEGTPMTVVPQGAGQADGFASARLRIEPALLAGLGATPVTFASGYSDRGVQLFTLELARLHGQVVLRSVLHDAEGLAERSAWFAVDPQRQPIALAWQAAGAAAADGYLQLAGGAAPQTVAARAGRAALATLQIATQQNLPWARLIGD